MKKTSLPHGDAEQENTSAYRGTEQRSGWQTLARSVASIQEKKLSQERNAKIHRQRKGARSGVDTQTGNAHPVRRHPGNPEYQDVHSCTSQSLPKKPENRKESCESVHVHKHGSSLEFACEKTPARNRCFPAAGIPEKMHACKPSPTLLNLSGWPGLHAQSAHILLMEADDRLRSELAKALEAVGLTVLPTGNLQEAHAILAERMPEIILIEPFSARADPPGSLVPCLLERTRNDPYHKVIVHTGTHSIESAQYACFRGVYDFILKPAPMECILGAVQRAVFFSSMEQRLSQQGYWQLRFSATAKRGLHAVREDASEQLIRGLLRDTGFNVYRSAQLLGITREALYYSLRKYGFRRDDFK